MRTYNSMADYAEDLGMYDANEVADAHTYTLLYGAMSDPDYEESTYAILMKYGELYEYEDSHCSCDGFHFRPVKVTLDYLRFRHTHGFIWTYDSSANKAEIDQVLHMLEVNSNVVGRKS